MSNKNLFNEAVGCIEFFGHIDSTGFVGSTAWKIHILEPKSSWIPGWLEDDVPGFKQTGDFFR